MEAETRKERCVLVWSHGSLSLFSSTTQKFLPRDGSSHNELGLQHQSLIKKVSHGFVYRLILFFSVVVSSSRITLVSSCQRANQNNIPPHLNYSYAIKSRLIFWNVERFAMLVLLRISLDLLLAILIANHAFKFYPMLFATGILKSTGLFCVFLWGLLMCVVTACMYISVHIRSIGQPLILFLRGHLTCCYCYYYYCYYSDKAPCWPGTCLIG